MNRVGLLTCVVCSLLAPEAMAQNADAEQLFRSGQRLMKEGKVAEACVAFEKSNQAEHNVNTLVNLGDCQEKNGKVASAWKAFVDVAESTKGDKQQKALNKVANDRSRQLEGRLSFLTVVVSEDLTAITGLEILVDGQVLSASFWNTEVAIDGGTHEIVARGAGFQDGAQSIEVAAEQDRQSLTVTMLTAVPPDAALPPPRDGWDTLLENARSDRASAGQAVKTRSRSRWYGGVTVGLEKVPAPSEERSASDEFVVGVEAGRHQRLVPHVFLRVAAAAKTQSISDFAVEAIASVGFIGAGGQFLASLAPAVGLSTQGSSYSRLLVPELAYVHRGRAEVAITVGLDGLVGLQSEGYFAALSFRYHLH